MKSPVAPNDWVAEFEMRAGKPAGMWQKKVLTLMEELHNEAYEQGWRDAKEAER